MPNTPTLPIAAVEPALLQALRDRPNFVIAAEPGAGKTTRVPQMLLDAGVAGDGEIWVAQPRRIAARLAASFVARSLGEEVGQRVGYQVRFDSRISKATRIRYMTEGLVVQHLRSAPRLPGVAAVILDEFHERHADTDLALSLLRRRQGLDRPDLRIGVMSATLDMDPVAGFLDAPALRSEGRSFPIEIEHLDRSSDRPTEAQVARALRDLLEGGLDGDVLVLVPGAREMRRCLESCEALGRHHGVDLRPLHGDLPPDEQDAAISPGPRRKIIVATNVAETSITVEGVVAVVDTGLARKPRHNPWTGIPTLELAKISQASATQRAGRAGRTRPGRCIRLFTAHDLARRPAFDPPEIVRGDLAGPLVDLRLAGVEPSEELEWLDAPPKASWDAARDLLRRLGAVDDDGALTEVGRATARYPGHPRLGRLMVAAQQHGVARWGSLAAALCSERRIRRGDRTGTTTVSADVIADIEDLEAAGRDRGELRRRGIEPGAAEGVRKVAKQLAGIARGKQTATDPEEALGLCLLTAFVDRVGKVSDTHPDGARVVLAGGTQAILDRDSVVQGSEFLVATRIEERRETGRGSNIRITSAAAIEPEWLVELFPDDVVEQTQVRFDADVQRVVGQHEVRFDGLLLEARMVRDRSPQISARLAEEALAKGIRMFVDDPDSIEALLVRATLVAARDPSLTAPTEADVDQVLIAACEGKASFAELRKADLLGHLKRSLDPKLRAAVERLTPATVKVGHRTMRIHYRPDRDPWVESRLQDFFGQARGPAIMDGAQPLVLHLLAPNGRAVQVTTDLEGFWVRHYPGLRRTLMRRYPKHAWPEDGATAQPPAPRPRRRRQR